MADDFSPFLSGDTPEESLARLTSVEPVGLTELPAPVAKKFRAVLYLPSRAVTPWKWVLPPAIGIALIAGGVAIAYPAYSDGVTGDAVTLTVLALPLGAIGVLVMVGGARAQLSSMRGKRAALQAATQPDGTVRLRATLLLAKADFEAGATVMVVKIAERTVGTSSRPHVTVTLADSATESEADTTLSVPYFGEYDEAAHDQLRDGLRLYGLKAPQTFGDLPSPTVAE